MQIWRWALANQSPAPVALPVSKTVAENREQIEGRHIHSEIGIALKTIQTQQIVSMLFDAKSVCQDL